MLQKPDPTLDKRTRIVVAANLLFLRDGLRGTSMEGIAAEAEIAKATLYSVFKNKNEVFMAVAKDFARQLVDAVEQGLAYPGTVEERVSAGLCAKQEMAFATIYASPHAAELIGAKNMAVKKIVDEADEKIIRKIERVLRSDPATSTGARVSAQALLFASIGIADHSGTKARTFRRVEELTRTYLAGVRLRPSA